MPCAGNPDEDCGAADRIGVLNAEVAPNAADRQRIAKEFNGDPETGTLIAHVADAPHSDRTRVAHQIPHWMFAMRDTLGSNTYRALALVVADADVERRVREEIAGGDLSHPSFVGGLAYLEDSSNIGRSTEDEFNTRATYFSPEQRISAYNINMAAGGVIAEDALDYTEKTGQGRKWLIADYEAGDVVFHDPFMVHTATVNQSEKGIIRLSTDLRF